MIHWEHFSDVFMTSAVTGDGVDELRVIILLYVVYMLSVMITIATPLVPLSAMLNGNHGTATPTKILVKDIREKLYIHLNQARVTKQVISV